MIGREIRRERHDGPRGLWYKEHRLLIPIRAGGDDLGTAAEAAHELGRQVLERRLVALLAVHRDGDAVVVKKRVDEPVGEEGEGVDAARARVQRVARRARHARIGPRPIARPRDALVHHRDHQGVEVVDVLGGQAELAAHVVEDGHKVVPLPLVDVEVLVRGGHVAAGVDVRAAGEVAHDLHDEELEARPLRLLVPARDEPIRV